MSWDKQTINQSTIPTIAALLEQLGIQHIVYTIATVEDWGGWGSENDGIPLRRLRVRIPREGETYDREITYLDQMQRTYDCDSNDYVVTLCSEDEWLDTPLEIWLDEIDGEPDESWAEYIAEWERELPEEEE